MTNPHANVVSMSIKDMENTIFDIMTDNGMSDEDAENTIKSMSTNDMESYLSTAYENLESDE